MSDILTPGFRYGVLADGLPWPRRWRCYLARLAAAWFGSDTAAGELFLRSQLGPEADPVAAAGTLAGAPGGLARGQRLAQLEVGLPLIEIERSAFIKIEHGRLSAAMGSVHFDERTGVDAVFHGPAPPAAAPGAAGRGSAGQPEPRSGEADSGEGQFGEGRPGDKGGPPGEASGPGPSPGSGPGPSPGPAPGSPPGAHPPSNPPSLPNRVRDAADAPPDPHDLSLDELALLPTLVKRVERLGTRSWLPFFPVDAGARERLELLARCWRPLTHGAVCPNGDFAEMLVGHEDWLGILESDLPRIIMPG